MMARGKQKDTKWVCGPFRGGKAFRTINGFTPFVLYVSIFHMPTRRGSLSGFQSGLDADC